LALGISPAAASPPPFTIDPNALTTGGYSVVPNVGEYQGTSDALIRQSGATTQLELGWVQGLNLNDIFGSTVPNTSSGMVLEKSFGTPSNSVYNLYLQFAATVHGVSGFGTGVAGTLGSGDFLATLYSDTTSNDTFKPGAATATGGTPPSVTVNAKASGAKFAGDPVLAEIFGVAGDASTDTVTGAAKLDVTAEFVVCDGTINEGFLGSTKIDNGAATGCGSFDARTYFISPNPFYSFDFSSAQNSSFQDANVNPGSGIPGPTGPNVALNGSTVDVEFINTPEPATLAMFGTALILLGGLGWRQRRKA